MNTENLLAKKKKYEFKIPINQPLELQDDFFHTIRQPII